eukprot:m.63750 g.63750  ORF g.63750 m.63750 type:complete len:59 (-) comp19488_c0_seq3:128-304(-)
MCMYVCVSFYSLLRGVSVVRPCNLLIVFFCCVYPLPDRLVAQEDSHKKSAWTFYYCCH